jgi:hypothetical protein
VPKAPAQVGTHELAIDVVSNPCGTRHEDANQTPRSHGDDDYNSNVAPESSSKSTEQSDPYRAMESQEGKYQDLKETSIATTSALVHLTFEVCPFAVVYTYQAQVRI